MKRNLNLVKKILKWTIKNCEPGKWRHSWDIKIPGYTRSEITNHLRIMGSGFGQGELIENKDISTLSSEAYYVVGVTWKGYEFLKDN